MKIYKRIDKNEYYFILRETKTGKHGYAMFYKDSSKKRCREINSQGISLEHLENEKFFQKIDIFKIIFDKRLKRRILKTILVTPFMIYKLLPSSKSEIERNIINKFIEEIHLTEVDSKNILGQLTKPNDKEVIG